MDMELTGPQAIVLAVELVALAVLWAPALRYLLWRRREVVRFVPWELGHIFLILGVGLLVLIFVKLAVDQTGVPLEDAPPEAVLAAGILFQITAVFAILGVLLLIPGTELRHLGFSTRHFGSDVLLALAGYIVAVPITLLTLYIYLSLTDPNLHQENPVIDLIAGERSLTVWMLTFVTAALLAPLMEELAFRVVVQGYLQKVEARWQLSEVFPGLPGGLLPIVVTSWLFAMVHESASHRPALFVLSMMLGWLYWKTGRIWPSLLVHLVFNARTLILMWNSQGAT
jgi:membrane protease YdiL (CAAX protease family)